MQDMVKDITLEQFGVDDLHLRSQEHPPVSRRVPEKCPYLSYSVLGIGRSVNMIEDTTLKPLRVADLHLRSQEDPLMSGRVPDKCPDLSFYVFYMKRSVTYQILSILRDKSIDVC